MMNLTANNEVVCESYGGGGGCGRQHAGLAAQLTKYIDSERGDRG